jgi:hypothetical protein
LKELEEFRAWTTLAHAEAVEYWRTGPRDALVYALALAAWFGEPTLPSLYEQPQVLTTTVLRT